MYKNKEVNVIRRILRDEFAVKFVNMYSVLEDVIFDYKINTREGIDMSLSRKLLHSGSNLYIEFVDFFKK